LPGINFKTRILMILVLLCFGGK